MGEKKKATKARARRRRRRREDYGCIYWRRSARRDVMRPDRVTERKEYKRWLKLGIKKSQ